MSRIPAAALALYLAALPAGHASAGGRTIVGSWGATAAECGTTAAFVVAQQGIATDDMSCTLPGVSRSGDTVTFRGTCTNAGEAPAREIVVATLRGDRLDMRFLRGGASYVGMVACRGGRR